MIHGLVQSVVK